MMWVSFYPPLANGKLTSPVSSMIGDYQMAKKEFDLATSAGETPLYVIERVETKIQQTGSGVCWRNNIGRIGLGTIRNNNYLQLG